MNKPIRKVGIAMAVLFLALFVNLNVVQVLKGSDYRNNAGNARVHYNEYSSPRGSIQVQGVNIADSKETNDELKYLRVYPDGPTYAAVTGYYPFNGSATQLESSENAILSGDSDRLFTTKLADILTGRGLNGGSVQLTLNAAAQKAAYAAMKGSDGAYRPGAVVAIDPTTGAILADVSTPSYDPNVLSSHNLSEAAHALGCYQSLTFPQQGTSESDSAYAARRSASIKAQLLLRRSGSTGFLATYLKNTSYPLGDVEYAADPENPGTQIATWTPYLALDNLDGAKGITAAQSKQVASAYAAQFAAHKEDVDSTLGQFANGVSGCGNVPLDPTETFVQDNNAPSPLLNKTFFERYFAGSIFKIVDSAAALQTTVTGSASRYTPSSVVPAVNGYRPYEPTDTAACPASLDTACVENFDGETCQNGKTAQLQYAFAKSCNTAFAQLVVDKLGATKLIQQSQKFGFGTTSALSNLPPPTTPSTLGNAAQLQSDLGYLAQTAFGQRDVQITPVLAAMLSAAVANNGIMMKPYLVKSELRPNLTVLDTTTPSQYSQVADSSVAGELQQMMEAVITSPEGTGAPANITEFGDQVKVGGKTGTADTGATSASTQQPDAWFTGFAMVKGVPRIAVAVLLEHAGVAGNESAGGLAAGPVAKKVMTAYLKNIGIRG